jgi:hypothetical protein
VPIITPGGGSGGGGAQTVVAETFNVTAAQILNNLQTVGCPITSAPSAGQFIWPLSVLVRFNFVSSFYSVSPGGSDTTLYVSTLQEYTIEPNGGFWMTTETNLGLLVAFSFTDYTLATVRDDVSAAGAHGQALRLFSAGPGISFVGGNSTLTVETAYILRSA